MSIVTNIKNRIRDAIPQQYQVPLKYYYNWIKSDIEPEMRLLEYIVNKNDLVIDIGANRGIYTFELWKLGARLEVFEPNPVCYDILIPWAKNKANIHVHKVGLSNKDHSSKLHIPIDENGVEHDASATIENSDFKHFRKQHVVLKSLDGYQFQNIDFIKIDVEGHEYKVIEGAKLSIVSSKPAILVEIEQRHNKQSIDTIFDKILSLGYRGFFFDNSKLITISQFDIHKHQSFDNFDQSHRKYINNFIFLGEEKIANGKYKKLIKTFL